MVFGVELRFVGNKLKVKVQACVLYSQQVFTMCYLVVVVVFGIVGNNLKVKVQACVLYSQQVFTMCYLVVVVVVALAANFDRIHQKNPLGIGNNIFHSRIVDIHLHLELF